MLYLLRRLLVCGILLHLGQSVDEWPRTAAALPLASHHSNLRGPALHCAVHHTVGSIPRLIASQTPLYKRQSALWLSYPLFFSMP